MDQEKLDDFCTKVFEKKEQKEVKLEEGVVLNDQYYVPKDTEIVIEESKKNKS